MLATAATALTPKINVLFTISFATSYKRSFFPIPSLFDISLDGFNAPYSMVYAVEAKTNDKKLR
jgi:hypothetical protein